MTKVTILSEDNLQKRLDDTQDALKALGKALEVLSSAGELDELLYTILEGATMLGYSVVMLQLIDEESEVLRFQKTKYKHKQARKLLVQHVKNMPSAIDIPLSEKDNICVKAFLYSEVYTTNSIYDSLRPLASREIAENIQSIVGIRITAAVPLVASGRQLGVLTACSTTKDTLISEEVEVLQIFADQAAWAMEKEQVASGLRDMSLTDPLTDLPNRRAFTEQIKGLISVSKEQYSPFSVLFIDVDDLKGFNDRHGHQAGDELLKAVGDALRHTVRTEDIVCRYGGDEFVVLLRGLNAKSSLEVAKRSQVAARRAANEIKPGDARGLVSIGIASYPEHGREGLELLNNADSAMYMAKSAGKSGISIYESMASRRKI